MFGTKTDHVPKLLFAIFKVNLYGSYVSLIESGEKYFFEGKLYLWILFRVKTEAMKDYIDRRTNIHDLILSRVELLNITHQSSHLL